MFSDAFKKTEGSMFIKLADGETVIGAFAGEPLEFMNNFKLKSQYHLGEPSYPEGTSKRFKVNFVTPVDDGALIPRILEGTKTTAGAIEAILEKYGPEYFYEIKRNGSDKTTTYSILPERPMTDEEKASIVDVELAALAIKSNDEE